MTVVIVLVSAVLAGVAAAGVLRPYGAGRAAALERLSDPLEDERRSLLRALRDLDEERGRGELAPETYAELRHETELRTVAVLRALEARQAGALQAGLEELRPVSTDGSSTPHVRSRTKRNVVVGLACAAAVAVIVPVLAGSLSNRTTGQPITGDNIQPTSGVQAALAFYQQRVAQHPNDVAARLDLADHYLEAGAVPASITQYEAALKLDPRNPEALATLGFLVATAGNAEQGLAFVQKALETDPTYPEGLYYEGAILLRYLHRPADAIAPLEEYLRAAPFGARRQAVQSLLAEARAADATPSPSASQSG